MAHSGNSGDTGIDSFSEECQRRILEAGGKLYRRRGTLASGNIVEHRYERVAEGHRRGARHGAPGVAVAEMA